MALYLHRALGTSPGESWSFGLYTEGDITLAAAQSAWSSFTADAWNNHWAAIIAPDIVMTEVTTATITQATGGQVTKLTADVNRPGLSEDEMLPFQCATAVTLRTDLATRGGRGRYFLPPLDTTTVASGRLTSGAAGVLTAGAGALWGGLDGAGLTVSLYSRVAHTVTPVTTQSVGDVVDTQRRRRNKLIELRYAVDLA